MIAGKNKAESFFLSNKFVSIFILVGGIFKVVSLLNSF